MKPIKLALTGLAAALVLAGCGSSSNNNGGSGTGGVTATGGVTGTGGSSTGGTTATGGTTGTGGVTASGGVTGSGGTASGGGGGGSSGHAGGGATGTGGGSAGSGGTAGHAGGGGTGAPAGGGSSGGMTLTSPDQAEGAKFGTMFTCAANNGTIGGGINPELDWTGVPAGTMSFAMTFIDTKIGADNAMGQHWAIWNIPPDVRQFPKGTTTLTGALATALQTNKFLAPCPSGNDTYEFTLYALSQASLTIDKASGTSTVNSAGVAKVLAALQGVTPLAKATLHGTSGPGGK